MSTTSKCISVVALMVFFILRDPSPTLFSFAVVYHGVSYVSLCVQGRVPETHE